MNQAIADIIKSHIEGLDFVDKIAGLTRVLTFDIKGPDNTPVQKSFPVACCVTADDCKEGAYNDLMPNSQYKTVIYFEDMGVTADRIEGRYSYFISNVRLVCWINAAKILGDTCQTGTACTLSAHLIAEIIRALPEFKQHHNPFNMVLSKVTSQEVSSPSIFSQYTYDEKHTQYLMYPYDYFALDIQTEFAICMKGTSVYDSDCGHRIDTLDAPVATAGTGASDSSFIAHCNAVTGALGYAIDVATDSGFTDFVLQDERIGNIRDVTISGLDDNTTYYYRFRAYNDFIESENSNVISVTTIGWPIEITTTISGNFSISFRGTGDIVINWSDGSALQTVSLTGMGVVTVTHGYTGSGSVKISNPLLITYILANNQQITSIIGLDLCVNITDISFSGNLLTSFITSTNWTLLENINVAGNTISSFTTYPSWVNLVSILVFGNQLTAFVGHTEWTNIENIAIDNNQLTEFIGFASWTNLKVLEFGPYNNITEFITFPEWVNMEIFDCELNLLTDIIVPVEWTKIQVIGIQGNLLTGFVTHPEWVALEELFVSGQNIASLTTYAQWVNLITLDAYGTTITSFIAHSEWVSLGELSINNCAINNDTIINNILIELDASGITSGNINMDGGTNAAPSGAGIIAKNNLIAKGVNVVTN